MKNLKKYFFYGLATLLLLVISEVIFNIRNKTPLLVSSYYQGSNYCAKIKKYSCSVFFLNQLVKIQYQYYKDLYPAQYTSQPPIYFEPDWLQKYGTADLFDKFKLTDIYYKLGLNAYKRGDSGMAEEIWQRLIYLDPDTSYLYVELANLYYKDGHLDKANEVINRCLLFEAPKKHCNEFSDIQLSKGKTIEPGFMKDTIANLK